MFALRIVCFYSTDSLDYLFLVLGIGQDCGRDFDFSLGLVVFRQLGLSEAAVRVEILEIRLLVDVIGQCVMYEHEISVAEQLPVRVQGSWGECVCDCWH